MRIEVEIVQRRSDSCRRVGCIAGRGPWAIYSKTNGSIKEPGQSAAARMSMPSICFVAVNVSLDVVRILRVDNSLATENAREAPSNHEPGKSAT